jgi:hypothetical protein
MVVQAAVLDGGSTIAAFRLDAEPSPAAAVVSRLASYFSEGEISCSDLTARW